jgi:hypothetical protein
LSKCERDAGREHRRGSRDAFLSAEGATESKPGLKRSGGPGKVIHMRASAERRAQKKSVTVRPADAFPTRGQRSSKTLMDPWASASAQAVVRSHLRCLEPPAKCVSAKKRPACVLRTFVVNHPPAGFVTASCRRDPFAGDLYRWAQYGHSPVFLLRISGQRRRASAP